MHHNTDTLEDILKVSYKVKHTFAIASSSHTPLYIPKVQFSSVQLLSHVQFFATPWAAAHQVSLSITNSSCPLSSWCHPTILFSVISFSSCLQSFSASESFPTSQFFISGGQSIAVSASTSVLPMNIQGWFTWRWTGWISLLFKDLSRVFFNIIV